MAYFGYTADPPSGVSGSWFSYLHVVSIQYLDYRARLPKCRLSYTDSKAMPWIAHHALKGVSQVPRNLDSIAVGYWAWRLSTNGISSAAGLPSDVPDWFTDISQGVQRTPWGPIPSSINQQSKIYSFALDRMLDPEDWVALVFISRICSAIGSSQIKRRTFVVLFVAVRMPVSKFVSVSYRLSSPRGCMRARVSRSVCLCVCAQTLEMHGSRP